MTIFNDPNVHSYQYMYHILHTKCTQLRPFEGKVHLTHFSISVSKIVIWIICQKLCVRACACVCVSAWVCVCIWIDEFYLVWSTNIHLLLYTHGLFEYMRHWHFIDERHNRKRRNNNIRTYSEVSCQQKLTLKLCASLFHKEGLFMRSVVACCIFAKTTTPLNSLLQHYRHMYNVYAIYTQHTEK